VRLYDRNWLQVEEYLEGDDRVLLPVGSTEQHAYLSLGTDNILAERVAVEAAEPLGVLVLPAMPFGIAPGFAAFAGTVSLRPETLVAVLTETLDTLRSQASGGSSWSTVTAGTRRRAGRSRSGEHAGTTGGTRPRFVPSQKRSTTARRRTHHGSRTSRGRAWPASRCLAARSRSYGGPYAVPEEQALRVWAAGVAEVRALIDAL
jgi:creatinine amidohydrolase